MGTRKRRVVWGVLALGMLAAAGCAEEGEIHVANNSDSAVDVRLGDEAVDDMTAAGGAVLHTNDCFDPIVVTYEDGGTVELEGPICPGQELVISDETAELMEAASTT